jgi:hypothetical protein
MTKDEYDSETDYNGSRGHAQADKLVRQGKFKLSSQTSTPSTRDSPQALEQACEDGFIILPDPSFERQYFEYSPEEDPTGEEGKKIRDESVEKAKIEGLSPEAWVIIHKAYYSMRKEAETMAYQR